MATGVILAGGKGKRFGKNKALTRINGKCLIEWIIQTYKEIFDEIIISTNDPSAYQFTGIKIVKDLIPHKGPLVGIYSCLRESMDDRIFVSACDMPFIKTSLINYMVRKSCGYDVVVPSLGEERLEPLHALYAKSCLPAIEKAIDKDEKRIISFYADVRVYKMEKEEMLPYDPGLTSFFNINTKEDIEKANAFLSGC
ncbi:molybdenum cofactor guanylyltransferase MobA [bacterium]|nr:molybdenum cofactor guanylyltransferase MobA [bacterium]